MSKYYPLSQIKTNLYTNGDEFYQSDTGKPYSGYYYTISDGDAFTGKNPANGTSILLIPLKSNNSDASENESPKEITTTDLVNPNFDIETDITNVLNYMDISGKIGVRNIPSLISPIPSLNDYKIGEFQRYFAKKTNELIYIEINKITYNKLLQQDSTIAFDLYIPISLPWNLVGEEKQVFESNKKIVELVERRNNWYGFTLYFKDNWLQYYNPIRENLFTSGGEYTTKDGKEYIGDYHIHPDKGPMVGAVHVPYPHDYLFPISSPTGSIDQPSTPLITPTTPSYSPPTMGGGGGGY